MSQGSSPFDPDVFASVDEVHEEPWTYVSIVMPAAGVGELLRVLAGSGFVDTDWCEMRRPADRALVDYGPCPPPWRVKATTNE